MSTFLRAGSDLGNAATVTEFIRQCGLVPARDCAFSAGSVAATQRKWARLLRRTKAAPAVIQGQAVDDRAVLSYVQGSIYILRPVPGFSRCPGWIAVAGFLQTVWQASSRPSGRAAPPPLPAPSGSTPYVTSAGRELAVICGESFNPSSAAQYAAQARSSYARAGLNSWPFVASCEDWTARAADPYRGPWNPRTPGPVLVIGNRFDPAPRTPARSGWPPNWPPGTC